MRLATVRLLDRPEHGPLLALQLASGYLMLEEVCQRLGKAVPWRTGSDQPMLAFLQAGPAAREIVQDCAENAVNWEPSAEGGSSCGASASVLCPAAQVQLLLPFQPLSVRDFLAWEDHYLAASRTMIRRYLPRPVAWLQRVAEMLGSRRGIAPHPLWYQQPLYYKGNGFSFVGPDEEIRWPAGARDLDFELEIGFVLDRAIRDASPEQAERAIAAYTIFNDFTARDWQIAEMRSGFGPAKCKDFDTGNAMGPVFVTPDEIPDLAGLCCRVIVNGQEWVSTTARGMRWHPCEMLAYASRGETLHQGEFFATGTVAGCSGVELDRWLQPGDCLELEVERIGTLRNRIGAAAWGAGVQVGCSVSTFY